MIPLEKIVLREITPKQYTLLKELALVGTGEPSKEENGKGYALIEKPLIYESYETLLWEFIMDTPGARRASVRLEPDYWDRASKREMSYDDFVRITGTAKKKGFIYLHFFERGRILQSFPFLDKVPFFQNTFFFRTTPSTHPPINNEIGFDTLDEGVVSTSLYIPGRERSRYTWNGSSTRYTRICALYVPEDKAREVLGR